MSALHAYRESLGHLVNRYWMAAVAMFIIHNAEEVVRDMPAWGAAHFEALAWAETAQSGFLVFVITLCVMVTFVAFTMRSEPEKSYKLLRIFLTIMILVALWHIALSLFMQDAQPGVYTAVPMLAFFVFLTTRLKQAAHPLMRTDNK